VPSDDQETLRGVLDGAARVLLDASPNAVVGIDGSGIVRYVNWRAGQLFGYDAGDIVGRPVEMLLDPALEQEPGARRRIFLEARASQQPAAGHPITARHADGSAIPVEISLTPVATDGATWVFAAVRDVRAWQASQAKLAGLSRVYQTLAETNQAIVRARDEQALFDAACRIAVGSGGYLAAFIGRVEPDGSIAVIASAGALGDYIAGLALTVDPASPYGRGPTAAALTKGSFHYSADFGTDDMTGPWRGRAARYGIRASATLPLRCDDSVVAAMTLYSDVPDIFDAQMRTLLEGMATNISAKLSRLHADAELRRTVAQRSALLARLVEAQEDERAKIAADVHDDPVQVLSAVALRLGSLHRRVAERAPELSGTLEEAGHAVAAANERLRALLFDLEPIPAGLNLVDALRDVAANLFEAGVGWTVEGDADLPAAERQQAVRIAKEALTNVRTHSAASRVRISVAAVGDGVEVAVVDDGIGLDPETVRSPPGHRGLASMRDRAEIAGGWLRLESGAAGGTTVRFWIPDHAADQQSMPTS
jgi:PAS domain S-box-containing protein